jgi:hypothetical protein
MSSTPNTTAVALPSAAPHTRPLTGRQERYARCVAAGMSYAEAFRQGGLVASTVGSQSQQISDLNRNPGVRARVRELRAAVDAEIVSTLTERMAWLRLIINADPEELSRVVVDPCDHCWSTALVAEAWAAHFDPSPFAEERPPQPNTTKPRAGCTHCKGRGYQRVELTPTDELSPEGRALFKGASQDKDGVITISTQSKSEAAEMLNKLQGAYVSRSMNFNATVNMSTAREMNPADLASLIASFDT